MSGRLADRARKSGSCREAVFVVSSDAEEAAPHARPVGMDQRLTFALVVIDTVNAAAGIGVGA